MNITLMSAVSVLQRKVSKDRWPPLLNGVD